MVAVTITILCLIIPLHCYKLATFMDNDYQALQPFYKLPNYFLIHYAIKYKINSPSANLFSSSVLPIALEAWHICLKSSSKRRIQRMTLPEGRHTRKIGYD